MKNIVVNPAASVGPAYCGSLGETIRGKQSALGSVTLSYAQELRALGQALENQGLVKLQLLAKGGDYFVRGLARSPREPRFSFLDRLDAMIAATLGKERVPRTRLGEVLYQFPPERVRQLDREGRERRVNPDQAPNPFRLSQLLRSAGCYVDRKMKSSILGITVQDHWLTVTYRTENGFVEETKEDLDFFYEYWIRMSLGRHDHPRLVSTERRPRRVSVNGR
jgi:hypothetical protein